MAVATHYVYDASHRLTAITLNDQAGGPSDAQTNLLTTLTYDTSAANATFNRLTQLVDPMGYDVQVSYAGVALNAGGQLVGPQTVVWQLQEAPCPLPAPAPAADANNCTTPTSTGRLGAQTTYTATTDGLGTLARIDAPLGAASVYSYNANGQVTQVSQKVDDVPHYRVTTATYDANGNTLTQTVGASGSYTAGLATNTADAPALTTTYTYDAGNNVLTATDPMGVVTQYTYDAPTTGNLLTVVKHYVAGGPSDDHTNVTTSSTYDAFGEVLTTTDPLGVVTTHTYDGYGDVTQTVANYKAGVPANADTNVTTSATFDSLGEQLSSTDPTGTVTTTGYDIRGRVTQTVANAVAGGPSDDHTNVTSKYTYDMLDRRVSATDPRGFVTRSFYDGDSRTTKSVQNCVDATTGSLRCDQATTPDNQSFTNVTSTTAYDAAGNATLATDPKGNQSVTHYDALNRPLEAIQQSGDTTPVVISDQTTGYDEAGDVIAAVVDPAGKHLVTSTTYDGAGRKKLVIAPPANPNATDPTDPNGVSNVTTYTYDADSNITDTQVSNPRVSTTGNVVGETSVQYDALGRATRKVEQAQVQVAEPTVAQTTSYSYDAAGRATQTTDASGTTSTSYDAVGRVIGVLHPGSTQPDSTTYDLGNRVTTTTNGSGTTKTFYDALWRVVKEEHYDTSGVLISTTSHAYDANGNELNPVTTLANGTQSGVTYAYDPLGRVSSVSDNARTYTYDANGRIGTMTAYSDPAKTTLAYQAVFGYDAGTRTSTLTDKVGPSGVTLHSYSYSYDTANNRTAVTEDGTTTKYLYDNLNELTQVTDTTGTTTLASYTYDANHNRATMVTAAGTTHYTYDTAGSASGDVELMRKTDPDGTLTTYTYDTAGDLTQAVSNQAGVNQTTTYVYDMAAQGCAKRLCEVDRPDGTRIRFTYDADGNRLSKTVTTGGPVPTTTVVKDVYQAGRIAYQTDGAGTTLATFTYDAGGMPASVQVGSDPATAPRYYYIYNPHGDVVALTDASGNTVATYGYDVFGGVTTSESFANGWTNPYRYDGKDRVRYDSETSLYWMSVRAYDPTLGRFLSRDPLGRVPLLGLATQPYVYAGNNPLKNVDPSGQFYVDPDGTHGAALDQLRQRLAQRAASAMHTSAGSPGGGTTPQGDKGKVSDCTGPCRAKEISDDSVSFFGWIGGVVTVVGALLAAVGAVLMTEIGAAIAADIAAAFETFGASLAALPALGTAEVLGANIVAAGAEIALFGATTAFVAFLFSDASSHAANSGWWTQDNLETVRAQALAAMGAVAGVFSYIADKVAQLATVAPILEKGAFGAWLGAEISLLGSGIIIDRINSDINDEEEALRE